MTTETTEEQAYFTTELQADGKIVEYPTIAALQKASEESLTWALDKLLPETEEEAQQIVKSKTICIALTLKKMGTRRKVNSSTDAIETDVDRSLLLMGKLIIDSPELEAIITLDGKIRAAVKKKALTVEMPLRGCYLLPISAVSLLDEQLVEFQKEREALVDAYAAAYPARIAEAEQRLGKLFNEADYLDANIVKDAFRMSWSYPEPVKVAANLKEVSHHIFSREIGKMGERCQDMLDQVEAGLLQYMDQFITKLVDSLSLSDDGKPKRFEKSTVKNFVEFLNQLPQMNITNNEALAELGKKAQAIMEGVDPQVLRKDLSIRQLVQGKLSTLKNADLSPLMITKPGRKFSFAD